MNTQPADTKDYGVVPSGERCRHNREHYCGICAEEAAPKCEHGRAFYCRLCGGPVVAKDAGRSR